MYDDAGAGQQMESRRCATGGKSVAPSSLRAAQQSCSVWWLLDGTNNEGSQTQRFKLAKVGSVIILRRMNQWRNNEKPLLLIALLSLAGCATEEHYPARRSKPLPTGFISIRIKPLKTTQS
jgi:hypothetical protein